MVPLHGEGAVPIADTPESMLMFSVRISTTVEEQVKNLTELLFYTDVLDWVKSETGAEDGCPRDCPAGGCPTRPPPQTTTPPPDTCEDTFCSSKCTNAKRCRRGNCKKFCKRHCNDAFNTGYVCN